MAQITSSTHELHPPYLVRMCKHIWRLKQSALQNAQHSLALIQREGPCMRRIQSWSEKLGKQNLPTPTSEKKKTSLRAWSAGMDISKSIMENVLSGAEQVSASVCTRLTASFSPRKAYYLGKQNLPTPTDEKKETSLCQGCIFQNQS